MSAATDFQVEVIGAGWGRTGTASLKKALEILGYPTYHMFENFVHKQDAFWIKVADKKEYNFNECFELEKVKFTATVDFPSSQYWREQLKQYPNAKVILSIRDPEKWYKSCLETIFCMIGGSPHMPWGIWICRQLNILSRLTTSMTFKVITRDALHCDYSKENVLKCFNEHNNAVIKECPPEKLLVYEVSQGWEPLCKFLNKPVPDVPFPHVNDTEEFRKRVVSFNRMGYMVLAGAMLPVVAYFVYGKKSGGSCCCGR
jgi:hypothetical protein